MVKTFIDKLIIPKFKLNLSSTPLGIGQVKPEDTKDNAAIDSDEY